MDALIVFGILLCLASIGRSRGSSGFKAHQSQKWKNLSYEEKRRILEQMDTSQKH